MSLTENQGTGNTPAAETPLPKTGTVIMSFGLGIVAIALFFGIAILASGGNAIALTFGISIGVLLALAGFMLRVVALLEHIAKGRQS